ncbi:hypothetical protein EV183_004127 [Coemansia sp. RSA 2336]|nr:hypothetical protein EV183_004127 [Coemansia sp. RSA 2336]
MSQLFVGRLPRQVQSEDLEKIFEKYGKLSRCDVKRGVNSSYGFVEYVDASHAPNAMAECNGMTVEGETIVVEMATGAARKRNDSTCFRCGQEGHWAKDCSGSGSGRRNGRGRSPRRREAGRGHRRDWSKPANDRERSRPRRSPSPDRRHRNGAEDSRPERDSYYGMDSGCE